MSSRQLGNNIRLKIGLSDVYIAYSSPNLGLIVSVYITDSNTSPPVLNTDPRNAYATWVFYFNPAHSPLWNFSVIALEGDEEKKRFHGTFARPFLLSVTMICLMGCIWLSSTCFCGSVLIRRGTS